MLQLTTSYRSLPSIQRFVNAAFAEEMVANDDDAAGRLRAAAPSGGRQSPIHSRPSWRFRCLRPIQRAVRSRHRARAIEESLPDAVGAFIEWSDREERMDRRRTRLPTVSSAQVPSRPQHIADPLPPLCELR